MLASRMSAMTMVSVRWPRKNETSAVTPSRMRTALRS